MSYEKTSEDSKPFSGLRIVVLMGGPSPEREVSLVSGKAYARSLERLGAEVIEIDLGRTIVEDLIKIRPDIVVNGLHGALGEDGRIQGVLEVLQIPYTHSGVLASALAMDKAKSKAVLSAASLRVPGGGLYSRFLVASQHVLPPPYVIKPNREGSSVGVFLVTEDQALPPQDIVADAWTYGDDIMVEPYIAGHELSVAVVGGNALMVTEILPRSGFYDFKAKYEDGGSRHLLPAPLSQATTKLAMTMAETAHKALGCHGLTRSDFRYDPVKDDLVLLEVNTQPGFTPTSLVPEQAIYCGWTFDGLVRWVVEDAKCPR